MWWYVPAGILLGVIVVYGMWRHARTGRRRATRWENLHERSKMIAAQLQQMKEAESKRNKR